MAQAYNPCYSGGRDHEDSGLSPAVQKVHKTPSQKSTCHPNYMETINRIMVQASTGVKWIPSQK
jgi:hypothetical protein